MASRASHAKALSQMVQAGTTTAKSIFLKKIDMNAFSELM
jgi:hypothetical protein